MVTSTPRGDGDTQTWTDVPIDWEGLEDAFENNAPEVHSYLHIATGDVLRVVDGIADPQMHARIAADPTYLRIEPVSSREQYRWMERYIPMVEDLTLQDKLNRAIDGKGAFRRFKDVLMSYGPERERWFAFRSERLRIFMEAWLNAHALNPVKRPAWAADPEAAPDAPAAPISAGGDRPGYSGTPRTPGYSGTPRTPGYSGTPRTPGDSDSKPRRSRSGESLRRQLRNIVESLGHHELDQLAAFGEFLRARSASTRQPGGADSQPALGPGDDVEDGAAEGSAEMDRAAATLVTKSGAKSGEEMAEEPAPVSAPFTAPPAPISERPASEKKMARRKSASQG